MRRFSTALVFGLILSLGSTSALYAASRPSLTRAETVALIVDSQPQLRSRLQWYIKNMPPIPLYADANPKAWYGPYLETAFEAGIIIGNDQRTFRPKADITTEEAAAMLMRLRNGGREEAVVLMVPGSRMTWADVVLADAASSGLYVPQRIRLGSPIHPSDLYAMMRSAGIQSPESVVLSVNPSQGYLPKPVVVAQATIRPLPNARPPVQPVQPRPVVTQPRPTVTQPRPVVTQPRPTQPAQPAPKPKPAVSQEFTVSVPTVGINKLKVTHPTDPFTSKGLLAPLSEGVGHLFTYPGNAGKILIYGHSSSFPWDTSSFTKIFRQINKVNIGDKVYVTYEGKEYVYEVFHKQAVPAGDMSAYQSSGTEELILYTCWPPDSISQRYLVHAKPI